MINKKIALKVKFERMKKGFSQEELAFRAGLSRNSIWKIETEKASPTVETLAKMVTLATKAWIYNNLIIDIDRAAMECGADVGKIKEIIEEYRDANQLYDEQRPLWFGAQMLDSDVRQRLYVYSI